MQVTITEFSNMLIDLSQQVPRLVRAFIYLSIHSFKSQLTSTEKTTM